MYGRADAAASLPFRGIGQEGVEGGADPCAQAVKYSEPVKLIEQAAHQNCSFCNQQARIERRPDRSLSCGVVSFLKTDAVCRDAKIAYDKKRFSYWVYFIPGGKVFECQFAEHEETIIGVLADFFGKSIIDYNLNALKKFIINSFEIRSSQSSVSSIAEDVEFIQLSAFSRCAGAHGA